ncbi:MAG: serine/threonine-protein kinase [Phycisphaerales bacterium]|jgi:tetratricopeptide (TPR) repeat protein|nr:serine/threonine-protein kinase [Phycisphaerales bacterium]
MTEAPQHHNPGDRHCRELFDAVVDLPAEAREAYLRDRIDDADVRREVRSLLKYHDTLTLHDEPDRRIPADRLLGHEVGGCRIIRRIGTGGMGVVYEAEQTHPHRHVAIKVLRSELTSPRSLARLDREVELLGRLCHPGIARVYGSGTFDAGEGATPYFIMEYIDTALPLCTFANRTHLDTRERVHLFARVCDAMHHAHERGVLHRDLKPGNILVDATGSPRIIDFGVATTSDTQSPKATRLTRDGQMIGTLRYMSPEQITPGTRPPDRRIDVYALGAVLYELLSGRPPLDIDHMPLPDAAATILDAPPPPLSSADRTLRGDLDTICATAMSKEPERRYASAADMADDLRRWLHHEPIAAHPPSMFYLAGRFVRRHRTPVTAASIIIAILSVALLTVSGSLARETEQRSHAERERARLQQIIQTVGGSLGAVEHPDAGEAPLVALLNEMTRRADEGSMGQPTAEAAVRLMVARVLRRSGRIPEAALQLEHAADLYEAHAGMADPDTQACLLERANLHADLDSGLYDDKLAIACARRVLEWRDEHLGRDHPGSIDAAQAFAWAGRNMRTRYHEVQPQFRRVLSWLRSRPAPDYERITLLLLPYGLTHHQPGTIDQAVACYREAAALADQHLPPEHWAAIESRTLQGLAFRDTQRFDEAATVYEEMLPGLIARSQPEDTGVLRERTQYARILARGARPEEAVAAIDAAIATASPHLEPDHPSLLLSRAKRMEVLLHAGQLDVVLRESESLWPQVSVSGFLPRSTTFNAALQAAVLAGEAEAADRWMHRAISFEPDFPSKLKSAALDFSEVVCDPHWTPHVKAVMELAFFAECHIAWNDFDTARGMLACFSATNEVASIPAWMPARVDLAWCRLQDLTNNRSAASAARKRIRSALASEPVPAWMQHLTDETGVVALGSP